MKNKRDLVWQKRKWEGYIDILGREYFAKKS